MKERILVKTKELESFTIEVLNKYGLSMEDAEITAKVLLSADQRGIESHGVARLKRYTDGIKSGIIKSSPDIKTIVETPVSLVVDGDGGMGQPITYNTMDRCIKKAKDNLMCFASIRNSNHYGIAGYYTLMALENDMIGISLTNSAPLVVPTFAKDAVTGTNPISVGVPAENEKPFLLDMATSTVPRGKLEVYSRKEDPIPNSWATDEKGIPTDDSKKVLDNLLNRRGGGLLPLGGGLELTGGHKGYGLSAIVDIFSGILSGGAVGKDVYSKKGSPPEVAHFIGAINPEAFVGGEDIKKGMDYYINMLKNSTKAEGQDRIYVAGEKEYENTEANKVQLSLQSKVFITLNELGSEFGIKLEEI
ncbi:MAG: Ldh family oxidoreductase [Acidobacteriota bacterium]